MKQTSTPLPKTAFRYRDALMIAILTGVGCSIGALSIAWVVSSWRAGVIGMSLAIIIAAGLYYAVLRQIKS